MQFCLNTYKDNGNTSPSTTRRATTRRDLLPIYDSIPTGIFAATMMRASLAKAEKASAAGDLSAMIAAYEEMKGFKE